MADSFKRLKDSILKSGIPLESSITGKLPKFEIDDWGEFQYEREGKLFSTDILGIRRLQIGTFGRLNVNFLFECKYKNRGHKWFFIEFPDDEVFSLTRSYSNAFYDPLFRGMLKFQKKKLAKNSALNEFRNANFFDLPTVTKGVDICGTNSDENVIKEARAQSVFAACAQGHNDRHIISSMILSELSKVSQSRDWGSVPMASLCLPIVVTTAEIWKVRAGVTLEVIENSKDINELGEPTQGVLLPFSENYMINKFTEELWSRMPIESRPLVDYIKTAPLSLHRFTGWPGSVYVINYSSFEEVLSTGISNIQKLVDDLKNQIS